MCDSAYLSRTEWWLSCPRGSTIARFHICWRRRSDGSEMLPRGSKNNARYLESEPQGAFPGRLALQSIGEQWTIEYRPRESRQTRIVERPGYRLLISGSTDNIMTCRAALRRWLSRKANAQLKPWLVRLAREHGFQLRGVLVRSQRTRWGSCSKGKTISLNVKLLFIPEDLVQCVLIHRLCHTVHLNHSKKFWALLSRYEPDCVEREKALRSAGCFVPAWIDAK